MRKVFVLVFLALLVASCTSDAGRGGTPAAARSTPAENGSHQATEVSASEGQQGEQPGPGWVMPVPDLDYNRREGRELFRHYCAPCHGVEGGGDGFNAYNLDPRPRDLADPEFQQERSDEDLAAIIRSGGGVAGMSTGMPPWGPTLGERQIRNLVLYVRALAAEER